MLKISSLHSKVWQEQKNKFLKRGMSFCETYVSILTRLRYAVILVWLALGVLSCFFVLRFIASTTLTFDPPPGTPAAAAEDALAASFPQIASGCQLSAYIQSSSNLSLVRATVKNLTSVYLERLTKRFADKITISSYFQLMDLDMPTMASTLINARKTSMVIPIILQDHETSQRAQDSSVEIEDVLRTTAKDTAVEADVQVSVVGFPLFVHSIVTSISDEMSIMDAVVLPLAMLVLALSVQSLRLIFIPIFAVALTLSTSFGVMYIVARNTAVSSVTPSLMMSLCIAMSIDYSLFVLARFVEELDQGIRGPEVVLRVLRTSGKTVLVSGVTLMISFLGLLTFPLELLRSFGLGCGVTIGMALLISLTFSPSVLLCFPKFFEKANQEHPIQFLLNICSRKHRKGADDAVASALTSPTPAVRAASGGTFSPNTRSPAQLFPPENDHLFCTNTRESSVAQRTSQLAPPGAEGDEEDARQSMIQKLRSSAVLLRASLVENASRAREQEDPSQSIFINLKHILVCPWNFCVLLAVALVVTPAAMQCFKLQTTDSFFGYLPRGSTPAKNYRDMATDFGFGFTLPFRFVFTNGGIPGSPTVYTETFFNTAREFLLRLVNDTRISPRVRLDAFQGLPSVAGRWFSFSDVKACLDLSPDCIHDIVALTSLVSNDSHAMLVYATISVEPLSPQGRAVYHQFLLNVDEFAATAKERANIQIFISGDGPGSMDAVDRIYELFPRIAGLTATVIFVLVGFSFRSVVVPLRSIVSVALTEALVFGVAVAVYQTPGVLEWTGWSHVQTEDGISWSAPVVAFTVIVGIALDYDIFLITRVVEIMQDTAIPTTSAILLALCSTAKIITAAGVVMAVAFFGLLMSGIPILNLMGFLLVVAVLFDTFVVRALVVPSMMSLFGRWNWWPRSV